MNMLTKMQTVAAEGFIALNMTISAIPTWDVEVDDSNAADPLGPGHEAPRPASLLAANIKFLRDKNG